MRKHRRSHPNILIAGDFNHPDIDWESQSTTNPASAASHQKLLDILLQNSLFQTVRGITRPASGNTLDLIVTSNPALVENVTVHPGISDHNILTCSLAAYPKVQTKPPRKIYQFNKADPKRLKKAAKDFSRDFLLSAPEKMSVESNWTSIANFLSRCLADLVPSKIWIWIWM